RPLGTTDPDLLLWCEGNGRVLVSRDHRTMPAHLTAHLLAGRHLPGLLLLHPVWTIPAVIAALVLHDQACDPADLVDQTVYIPCPGGRSCPTAQPRGAGYRSRWTTPGPSSIAPSRRECSTSAQRRSARSSTSSSSTITRGRAPASPLARCASPTPRANCG